MRTFLKGFLFGFILGAIIVYFLKNQKKPVQFPEEFYTIGPETVLMTAYREDDVIHLEFYQP